MVDGEHFLIRPYIEQTAQALEKSNRAIADRLTLSLYRIQSMGSISQ